MPGEGALSLADVAVGTVAVMNWTGVIEEVAAKAGKLTSNKLVRLSLGASAAAVGAVAFFNYVMVIKPSRHSRKSKSTNDFKRAQSYPPPYPNAWYPLCNAEDVKPGTCKTVEALGRRFAVFRGNNGEIGVLDAVCPHNGANLASGAVVGDNLRCPFHFVEFATDGACKHVPWLENRPNAKASKGALAAKTWHWEDFHGMICVWFDAESRPPLWKLPRMESIDDGSMRFLGSWEADRPIEMHLAEFVENTVDVQHFTPMHGRLPIPWTSVKVPGCTVNFESEVVFGNGAPEEVEKYGPSGDQFLYFLNTSSLSILGRKFPSTTASAQVQFIGPATLIRFLFFIPDVGRMVLFQTHTPQNDKYGISQRVSFRWFAEREVPRFLAAVVVGEWISNWWEDCSVWEEKIKRNRPSLLRGDGPIQKARVWLDGFYSESSGQMLNRGFDW